LDETLGEYIVEGDPIVSGDDGASAWWMGLEDGSIAKEDEFTGWSVFPPWIWSR
jgi:hypothetical protein